MVSIDDTISTVVESTFHRPGGQGHHVLEVDLENSAARRLAETSEKFADLSNEAKIATDAEHKMSVTEAIKLYPKAIMWSVIFSSAVAMEGYDLVLVSSFFGYPAFTKKYGHQNAKGTYQISAPWQAGLNNAARVGEILGLLINGWLAERFGFRWTMIGTLVFLTGIIFIPFFSQNLPTLLAGDILLGIPWGVFQTLTTAYAAEVCPVPLRGYLTTYVNMMWGVGQIIASGVLRSLIDRTDEWAYRIPFALQWMWPVPIMIGVFLAPESPWWLVRKGRIEDAKRALRSLSLNSEEEMETTISMIKHTDAIEKEITAGTSYLDCFKGINLRRTEIVCLAWVTQSASGASLMGNAAYFFEQAGLPATISFDFTVSLYGVAIMGVWASWFAMTYLGRRTLHVGGLACLNVIMLAVGLTGLGHGRGTSYATGSLLLLFTLIYDITIGTVVYSIVAEISSSRLRTKTIVLARSLYNVQGVINGVITPYMLNPNYWNWKAKAGFFWAGYGFLYLVWAFFRLPEPKGRTYGELDLLFEQCVPARRFKSAHINIAQAQPAVEDQISSQLETKSM